MSQSLTCFWDKEVASEDYDGLSDEAVEVAREWQALPAGIRIAIKGLVESVSKSNVL